MPPDYGVMAAGCPAMTGAGPITTTNPIYIVATGLPDCRGASPVLTVGRGTPMPFGAPTPYGGPIRYGVASAPVADAKGKAKQAWALGLAEEQAWRRRLAADVAAARGKRVLLFVHGFNNTPDAALKRADAVGAATGFDGPVIAFLGHRSARWRNIPGTRRMRAGPSLISTACWPSSPQFRTMSCWSRIRWATGSRSMR